MTKAKEELRDKLYERGGHVCYYCGMKESDFLRLWGEFYGLKRRGNRLEIEHKDAVVRDKSVIRKTRKAHLKHSPDE